MAEVEMTETNPMGKRPGRKSLSDYTFNVNEIERSLTQGGGALSKKQKQTIGNLRKLDRDGDGDISLIEILSLEEDAERAQKDANRLRKIVCGIVIGIIFCLGCIMCMGIAAIEITKESRVRGGTPVATPGSSAALPASSSKFGIEMSTCMVNAYEIHFIFIYFLINRTTVFGKKKKEKHQINILKNI